MTRWEKKPKYGNKQVSESESFDGKRYHSKGEHDRAYQLAGLGIEGLIEDLRTQVPFTIIVAGKRICTYIADFVYRLPDETFETIEDYKGVRTATFNLKWKLMQALYPQYRYTITGAKDVRKGTRRPRNALAPKTKPTRRGRQSLNADLPGLGPELHGRAIRSGRSKRRA